MTLAAGVIGIAAVLVQAKDEAARAWYLRQAEFMAFPEDGRVLWLPVAMVVGGMKPTSFARIISCHACAKGHFPLQSLVRTAPYTILPARNFCAFERLYVTRAPRSGVFFVSTR
jgi:hypothetical protein